MDWKYSHFRRAQRFAQPPEAVLAAARALVADELAWRVTDTPNGFEAQGSSFLHAATARFQIMEADAGATLTIELQVERLSTWGYMLVDIGGYYDGRLRTWFEAIDDRLAGRTPSPVGLRRTAAGRVFSGVILASLCIMALWFVAAFVVLPAIGLVTGVLYVPPGRGSGADLTLHGPWARIVSAAILGVDGLIAYRTFRSRTPKRPRILYPP